MKPTRCFPAKTPAQMRAESVRLWGNPPPPAPDHRGLTEVTAVIKHGFAERDRKVEAWLSAILAEHGFDLADHSAIAARCYLVQRDPIVHEIDGDYESDHEGEMWLEIDGARVGAALNYHGDPIPAPTKE